MTPARFEDEYPEAAAALMALARGDLVPPRPVYWTVRSGGELIEYADKARRVVIARSPAPRIGRNEPCPCGSGKKFKKCCG